MKGRQELRSLSIVVAGITGALLPGLVHAQSCPTSAPGYTTCPTVYVQQPNFRQQQQADKIIAQAEKTAIVNVQKTTNTTLQLQEFLGNALLFDKTLSVNGNLACDSCHSRITGFTGPVTQVNAGTVAYHGSAELRSGPRRPIDYSYVTLAPVLHLDTNRNTFIGGTFSDMRATGLITGSPASDQALGPFLNPDEMGMPDAACVVFRLSSRPYAPQFKQVWGSSSFNVTFPSNTDSLCSTPNTTDASDPQVVTLSASDRAQVTATFQNIGRSIATFEAGTTVSPFSSKFDQVQAGTATFTTEEALGQQVFLGKTASKATCHLCHRADQHPALFTDFGAFNLGIPKNTKLPFYNETLPDSFGYIANPVGQSFIDLGIGAFLRKSGNPTWAAKAARFDGAFETLSLRNTARTVGGSFVKVHDHNGFFTSLQEIVHFYFTRDLLNTCGGSTVTVGVDCWPAPEVLQNRTNLVGRFGTGFASDEAALITFLNTLSDTTFTPL